MMWDRNASAYVVGLVSIGDSIARGGGCRSDAGGGGCERIAKKILFDKQCREKERKEGKRFPHSIFLSNIPSADLPFRFQRSEVL